MLPRTGSLLRWALLLLTLLAGHRHAIGAPNERMADAALIAAIETRVRRFFELERGVPSLAFGVVLGEHSASWVMGLRDTGHPRPEEEEEEGEQLAETPWGPVQRAEADTFYPIASCLKPMLAATLYRATAGVDAQDPLPEASGLHLDLPAQVAPNPMRIDELLSHRVSLRRDNAALPGASRLTPYTRNPRRGWLRDVDPMKDSSETLRSLFLVTHPDTFLEQQPVTDRHYSNDAYWVAGLVLASLGAQDEAGPLGWQRVVQRLQTDLWEPLGLREGIFCDPTDATLSRIALPYLFVDLSARSRERRFAATYCDRFQAGSIGEAYATVGALTRYLRANTRTGSAGLPRSLVWALEAARRFPYDDPHGRIFGTGWMRSPTRDVPGEVWHGGIQTGSLAWMACNPARDYGACLLTNVGCDPCCSQLGSGEPRSISLPRRLRGLVEEIMDALEAGRPTWTEPASVAGLEELAYVGWTGAAPRPIPVYRTAGVGWTARVGSEPRVLVPDGDKEGDLAGQLARVLGGQPDLTGGEASSVVVTAPGVDPLVVAGPFPRSRLVGEWRGVLTRPHWWSRLRVRVSGAPDGGLRVEASVSGRELLAFDKVVLGTRHGDPSVPALSAARSGERDEPSRWLRLQATRSGWLGSWVEGEQTYHVALVTREPQPARSGFSPRLEQLPPGLWRGVVRTPGGDLPLTMEVSARGNLFRPMRYRRVRLLLQSEPEPAAPVEYVSDRNTLHEGALIVFPADANACQFHLFGVQNDGEFLGEWIRGDGTHPVRLRRVH